MVGRPPRPGHLGDAVDHRRGGIGARHLQLQRPALLAHRGPYPVHGPAPAQSAARHRRERGDRRRDRQHPGRRKREQSANRLHLLAGAAAGRIAAASCRLSVTQTRRSSGSARARSRPARRRRRIEPLGKLRSRPPGPLAPRRRDDGGGTAIAADSTSNDISSEIIPTRAASPPPAGNALSKALSLLPRSARGGSNVHLRYRSNMRPPRGRLRSVMTGINQQRFEQISGSTWIRSMSTRAGSVVSSSPGAAPAVAIRCKGRSYSPP